MIWGRKITRYAAVVKQDSRKLSVEASGRAVLTDGVSAISVKCIRKTKARKLSLPGLILLSAMNAVKPY